MDWDDLRFCTALISRPPFLQGFASAVGSDRSGEPFGPPQRPLRAWRPIERRPSQRSSKLGGEYTGNRPAGRCAIWPRFPWRTGGCVLLQLVAEVVRRAL